MLVQNNTKVLRRRLDFASEGAKVMIDLLRKVLGLNTRTLVIPLAYEYWLVCVAYREPPFGPSGGVTWVSNKLFGHCATSKCCLQRKTVAKICFL